MESYVMIYVFLTLISTAVLQGISDDQLIENVFGNPSSNSGSQTNTRPKGKDINQLVDEVLNQQNRPSTTRPTTIRTPQVPNRGDPTKNCECVAYYLCKDNKIITDGEGLIDIRIEGECGNYLEVCCNVGSIVTTPITTTPPPQQTNNPVNPNNPNNPTGCGIRNPDGVGFRITGDSDGEAQFGEFPWMVAVLTVKLDAGNVNQAMVYQCGGSLIHPRVVLTAAHCVSNREKTYVVRAGEWDTQTKNEILPDQDRNVESVILHPHYTSGVLYNDIALLLLDQPMNIDENVNVACLPPQGFIADATECFATGWGKDSYAEEGRYQVILKKIELPIVDRRTCLQQLRNTRLGPHFELHESFICAGGEGGRDTCRGDGGSPLVCPIRGHPGRYHQSGIVAWGIGCGEANVPGVYVNVSMFRNWIDDQMRNYNLQPSAYIF